MTNEVQIYYSPTTTNTPTLGVGATDSNIALNGPDEKLFYYNGTVTKSVTLSLVDTALQNLVEDTTPQLGGNLDTQSFTVDGRDVSVDGTKLDGIAAGATANNCFTTITTAGETDIVADSSSDTLTLDPGAGISITHNAGNDKITLVNTGAMLTANTFTAGQFIDGSANAIQLRVKGHSTQSADIFQVENNAGTDLFKVDSNGLITSQTTGVAATMTLVTDNATGNAGSLVFKGDDGVGQVTNYGDITVTIVDNTNGSEDGKILLNTIQNGTNLPVATLELGITVGTATGGDQGADTVNASNYYTNGVLVAAALQPTLTDGVNISWDLSGGKSAVVTLADNRTLDNPTNMVAGEGYTILVKQDATGSRTLAYGSAYKFPGGTAPTLSTTANAVDKIECLCDGTNMYCDFVAAYS